MVAAPCTVQGQASTLKTFFRFAQEEGYLETNIGSRLKVPRAPQRIIQTFSEEQLRQPLATARSTRDKAILGLLIASDDQADTQLADNHQIELA